MALGVVRQEADGQTDRKSQEPTREAWAKKRVNKCGGNQFQKDYPFHANEN